VGLDWFRKLVARSEHASAIGWPALPVEFDVVHADFSHMFPLEAKELHTDTLKICHLLAFPAD
jgi:hypothetical protein